MKHDTGKHDTGSQSPPAEAIITWEEHQKIQRTVVEIKVAIAVLQEDVGRLRKDVDQLTSAQDGTI
jgi:hypothetical protein